MFRKSKKKIQKEILQNMEEAKEMITKIADDYQEFEIYNAEEIGMQIDFNYPRTYIYMLLGYGEDIMTLVNNNRYSSLYPLICNFLQCYGLCKNLITLYFNGDKKAYDEAVKIYYSATLNQRKEECLNFTDDLSLTHEDEVRFYNIRFEQMENIIAQFFDEYAHMLEGEDKDVAIHNIVEKLTEEMQLPIDVDSLVMKALRTNENFTTEEYKRVANLYISAKSASLNNIQTVLTRTLGMIENRPALLVNKNEGIVPIVLETVEKCLKDVTDITKEGFAK